MSDEPASAQRTVEPGWYCVMHDGHFVRPIRRTSEGWYVFEPDEQEFSREWPFATFTLGPAIENLLQNRDGDIDGAFRDGFREGQQYAGR